MKNNILKFFVLFLGIGLLSSCSDNDEDWGTNDGHVAQTLLMYWPWTGGAPGSTDEGLTSAFENNLEDLIAGIEAQGGMRYDQRVMVFFAQSATSGTLYNLEYNRDTHKVEQKVVKTYTNPNFGTSALLTNVLTEVKNRTHSNAYAMVYGGHGTGWTQKSSWTHYPYSRSTSHTGNTATWTAPRFTMTRFIGSSSAMNYALDLADVAQGIQNAGIKLQYLLFDDCYMANAETAFELRNVTEHLVASTSEVMAHGMPYDKMYRYMVGTNPDYSRMVQTFYDFYSTYAYPYGALSTIDCSKMDALVTEMKRLNGLYTFNSADLPNVQKLDGFDRTSGRTNMNIFFDIDSYVEHLATAPLDYHMFQSALNAAVVANKYTSQVFSNLYGASEYIDMNGRNSGMTISDPSIHPAALAGLHNTAWWAATH